MTLEEMKLAINDLSLRFQEQLQYHLRMGATITKNLDALDKLITQVEMQEREQNSGDEWERNA